MLTLNFRSIFILIQALIVSTFGYAQGTLDIDSIIGHIEELENVRDPKCYATASRLENFIYGTPLSNEARFKKNLLQKEWLKDAWQAASKSAKIAGRDEVSKDDAILAVNRVLKWEALSDGHWRVTLSNGQNLTIHKDDKRQYSTIAYSLRSLLAVQQELFLAESDFEYLTLSGPATDTLAEALDFYLLSVLQVSDKQTRQENQQEINENTLTSVWALLAQLAEPNITPKTPAQTAREVIVPEVLIRTVAQKLRSYQQYNELNNQLFIRNLQVFFARNRWPENSSEARQFRQSFTENVITFASEIYRGAQKLALENHRQFIREADVYAYTQKILPHVINEYEDALFFPQLPREQQVHVEAYDMDAFRDSGIHWQYLQYALQDKRFPIYLEPDPFAAELIVENIAQYGVLLLRVTGDIGARGNSDRIKLQHFNDAVNEVLYLARENNQKKDLAPISQGLLSVKSDAVKVQADTLLFTDISSRSGVDYMHRSSDWLNRLLRSYLKTEEGKGTIVIPPAFGGAGVAAGDVNNDGFDDILILGGLGNKLYLNGGDGTFDDVTASSGIEWAREDNTPGEPRQPIIADLDNDGWQDLLITYVDDLHRVYRNRGDGTFEDITIDANLGGKGLVGGPATVFDYDGDGLLDIYITYFGNYLNGVLPTLRRRNINGLPNKLFRNLGGFKFLDVTKGSGLDNRGWGQAVTHTDFNSDGLQDLIVGNDFGVNAYYQNLGNGKFVDVATKLGTDKPSYTMGIGLGDLNQDSLSDVYISNIVTMNKDEKYVLPSADTEMKFNPEKLARMRVVEANDLFLSRKKPELQFELSDKVGRGYSSTGWSWDADFFDFDNDGDDDLYVLNGMNDYLVYSRENPYYQDPIENQNMDVLFPKSNKEKNVFFINENGMLNNASKGSGLDFMSNGRSAVYLDIDNDGDLDIVTNDYHQKARVFINNSESYQRNWLKINLTGAPGEGVNLDAIGAKVIVTTPDNWSRTRELSGSIGYMSVHSKLLHFGLLNHEKANVTVIWPNGNRTTFSNIASNQTLRLSYVEKKPVVNAVNE
ncbi:CRTAC1 family protein [Planctobacterium marinum]|uniref:CRTAC1 family protein n=1 Tax=Planctobacterium marinum TaxID=1631968 RepID=UPI001E460464|nr:CRTAC1 family protein [Planctobacterium marinum]MCC2606109.1 CRTAC1 family protein [Planctobacterium marinum]